MRTHVIVRKTHKWLGLFVVLQLVIWSLSGLYMTVVHIDTIHGDHLIRLHSSKMVDAADLEDPLSVACEADQLHHPLIIVVGIAVAWLAVTGFWLLFRTMWRHDFAWLRRR